MEVWELALDHDLSIIERLLHLVNDILLVTPAVLAQPRSINFHIIRDFLAFLRHFQRLKSIVLVQCE